jgi:hypothetical protein
MIVVLLKLCDAVQQIVMVSSMSQLTEIFEVSVIKKVQLKRVFLFCQKSAIAHFFGD